MSVAPENRSATKNTFQTMILWIAVALLGAVSFAIVALNRGEAVNAAATAQGRAGLRADQQVRALRPSFRGHRRCGPPGRPGACGADGIPAGHALDSRRRGVCRLHPGRDRAVSVDPPRRPLAG